MGESTNDSQSHPRHKELTPHSCKSNRAGPASADLTFQHLDFLRPTDHLEGCQCFDV
jgi:hypothetical protein